MIGKRLVWKCLFEELGGPPAIGITVGWSMLRRWWKPAVNVALWRWVLLIGWVDSLAWDE